MCIRDRYLAYRTVNATYIVLEKPETAFPTNSIAGEGKKYITMEAIAEKSIPRIINGFCFPS